MAVIAEAGNDKIGKIMRQAPSIDVLGINSYGPALPSLPGRAREQGWRGPLLITELGPLGQWQAGRKPWGAPVEPTSSEKAAFFRDALAFLRSQPQVAGAFPFLWGAKQEQTETWHGLLLADGSLTAMTDALSAAWGRPVAVPAPLIRPSRTTISRSA